MAKVKAPLFSFEARGKLADALVYFPWKGIDAVRTHVIPANPRTTAQLTQRARMTAAVAEWHIGPPTAVDVSAWNRFANLSATSRSGFNRMVEEYIEEDILGNTWESIRDATIGNVQPTTFDVAVIKDSGGNAPTVRWGTSPTNMPNSLTLNDETGDVWDVTVTPLISGVLYYVTFDVGATGVDWGRTGILTQRTT